eukprot:GDKJ01022168.1.p1 GENE.GDKJ01022168.1~~GDKJ01022168.1.p1  ORF type:complete len:369 (-),score=70.39 GDKJ01022168.1:1826-2932(-)
MKKVFLSFLLSTFLMFDITAQLTVPPNGGNKMASVSERVGLTDVTINYHRPGVKGREGKIWGQLVHYGFADLGFGTSLAAPWRAGANENTTISFSTPVKIEGQALPAGKYGLMMAVQENEVTVIFTKNTTSWGSYYYDEKEDALRVKVKPQKEQAFVERLKFEFLDQTEASATIALLWEKWKIPFKVEVDLHETVFASMRNEVRGEKVFDWRAFNQAANYCLTNKVNLEEGLSWAERSIKERYIGEANFTTLSTKAEILKLLGRTAEAETVMKEALPKGNMLEIHQYARALLKEKKTQEAFEAFKLNASKNPNEYTPLVGLARGYSALGDYKNALKQAKLAIAIAPSDVEKDNVAKMIKTLSEGKDIN